MFSLVTILRASARRKKIPPSEMPKSLIRFGPIRFWIMADHLRSPTVRAAAVVMTTPAMSRSTLATAAP